MKTTLRALLIVLVLIVVGAVGMLWYLQRTGLNARDHPGAVETFIATNVRNFAVSEKAENLRNPVPRSPEAIEEGLEHFADHCAECHGNDGSGNTAIGQGLYPKVPDMRRTATQQLTDGELFWIIENGIRFTGMPAWGGDDESEQEDSWRLVHFIRELPHLTPEQLARMEQLNPRPPDEIRQQIEEERFLTGEDDRPVPAHKHKPPGGQP